MSEESLGERPSIARLVLIPALISLAVTLLRLAGELQHWSPRWFSSETGGVFPSGVSWLVGITWLPVPFGVYFALRLASLGQPPSSKWKAFLLAVLGMVISMAGLLFLVPRLPVSFPHILIFIWLIMVVAAIIQLAGWPALFKTLLVYGLASRIPVAIVMFLAMRGNWGTHYDYVGFPPQYQLGFWRGFFWLAFFPQLVFWVGFTILIGSLSGSIAAAFVHRSASPATTKAGF
jgi:hypothetical protein